MSERPTQTPRGNFRFISGGGSELPADSLSSTIRLADPELRKAVFAKNLNQLLDLVSANRKVGSEQIGLSYRWVRRMVSAGVSRPDKRNQETLARITEFFALPNADLLWRPDLVPLLIMANEGRSFVAKFGGRIAEVVSEQIAQTRNVNKALVEAWTAAQGGQQEAPDHSEYESRLKALIDTGKYDGLQQLHDACKRLINETYEKEFGDDRDKKSSAS